jgi:hypothetical protein
MICSDIFSAATGERSGLLTPIAAMESVTFVRADELLTAFLELESVIHRPPPISEHRKLDNFLFQFGLSFAFREE